MKCKKSKRSIQFNSTILYYGSLQWEFNKTGWITTTESVIKLIFLFLQTLYNFYI